MDKVPKPTGQICNKVGHTALHCYYLFDHAFQAPQNNQASVFIATPELVSDQSWYANSGATNHVTVELENLSMKSNYHGKDKLVVDNSNKLSITHVGHTEIPSLSSQLYLRNILFVPHIKKSLLSISCLTTDNKVFVEFHSNVCLVKNKENHQVLLHGKLEDGLYKLHIPKTKNHTKSAVNSFVNPSVNPIVRLNLVE